jgi:hypothetical protein
VFSEVDSIIFPDSCEVIQIASQQFVYPIFKCGRSSLTESMKSKGWTFLPEQGIANIPTPIRIFLRDPRDRFLSGVNTYLQHLANEGNDLDQHTVLYFINRYLFLNRHYAPQFFWLLNLARFSCRDTLVTFSPMTEISQLTDLNHRAEIEPITDELKEKINSFDWSKLELYLYLDQILLDHIGQTIKLSELIDHVQTNHSTLYKLVFQPTLNIANVLPKT